MSIDLLSILLSIPLAIIANIFTPKVQEWLNSRNNKKSVEKQQEDSKKDSQEDIELIKDRLITIGILCTPLLFMIISLGIIDDTVFMLFFIIFFASSIYLILRLIKRSMYVLKYKGERNVQKEIEKIKNTSLTIGIIYLPVILSINEKYMILSVLSFYVAFYYIIRSIIQYVRLLNKKLTASIIKTLKNYFLSE